MIRRHATRTALAVALAAGAAGVLGTAASAEGGCGSGAGWTVVGGVAGGTSSVTVTAPAGSGIVETCVWTGVETEVYSYDPAATSVVIAPLATPTIVEYGYRLVTLEPVPSPEPVPEPTPAPAPVPAPQPAVPAPAPTRPPASAARAASQTPAPSPVASAPASEAPAVGAPVTSPDDQACTSATSSATCARTTALAPTAAVRTSALVYASPQVGPAARAGADGEFAAFVGVLLLVAAGVPAATAHRRRQHLATA